MRWRDIARYEGRYKISDHGDVLSVSRVTRRGNHYITVKDRMIKLHLRQGNRPSCHLWKNNHTELVLIAKLVAETFICKRPEGLEIRHLDGNPQNNHYKNLKYGTHKENMQDMVKHGRSKKGEAQLHSKLKEEDVRFILSSKISTKILAEKYGVIADTIYQIRKRNRWKHIKF